MRINTGYKSLCSLTLAVVLSGALAACAKKNNDDQGAVIDARARASGTPGQAVNLGSYQVNKWTYLTPSLNFGSSNFENTIKDFISASWDRDYVGSITENDVWLQGYIETAGNGQLNLAASKITIAITDSVYKDGASLNGNKVSPYTVQIFSAASGSWNGNQFSATFKDEYQEITIVGSYSDSSKYVVNGTVSFKNLKDYKGEPLKSAQPMGVFSIQTCALMNCSK